MDFIIMFMFWMMVALTMVGVIFMVDALLFGLTGWSFIGLIDRII